MPWPVNGLKSYIQKKRNSKELEAAEFEETLITQSLKNYLLIATQPVSRHKDVDSIKETIVYSLYRVILL